MGSQDRFMKIPNDFFNGDEFTPNATDNPELVFTYAVTCLYKSFMSGYSWFCFRDVMENFFGFKFLPRNKPKIYYDLFESLKILSEYKYVSADLSDEPAYNVGIRLLVDEERYEDVTSFTKITITEFEALVESSVENEADVGTVFAAYVYVKNRIGEKTNDCYFSVNDVSSSIGCSKRKLLVASKCFFSGSKNFVPMWIKQKNDATEKIIHFSINENFNSK